MFRSIKINITEVTLFMLNYYNFKYKNLDEKWGQFMHLFIHDFQFLFYFALSHLNY